MKLIQCYIENFGKLKNQTILFSDGCQCFCHENGWGKSTLAAFLTVMLYGFHNERSRDDFVNERKRYRPWQGGVYGGTLTFEADGKRYTAERTFGLKEKEDYFLLREEETNLESNAFSSNLGEDLFGLDRLSFERTVFLSQKDCTAKTTDRIVARLGNLAEATDDMNQYEKADSRLHDLLNAMSPNRKTGSLYRLKEQISDLQAELRRGEVLTKEIETLISEKNEEEKTYLKYKEVQELLLQQQKEITLRQDRNAEKKDSDARNSSSESNGSDNGNGLEVMNRQCRNQSIKNIGIITMTGLLIMSGAVLLPQFKEIGIVFLLAGFLIITVSFLNIQKQRIDCETDEKEHDKTLSQQSVLQKMNQKAYQESEQESDQAEDDQVMVRIEEVQTRLRKIQIMMETSYRKTVHLENENRNRKNKKERLLEKEEQAAFLQEQYASDLLKYERLKMTKNYLAKAKESYLSKYRNPLMQSFSKYFEMLSGKRPDGFRMDADLAMTVQEYGIQRETRYFSEGWKDLMGICMRMSLVDVMYHGEKPFLIMDDPFVNLDQSKTEAALQFLNLLGEEYQILYFTCHESRSI